MLTWLLFPALTMALGWGLRGYIGGGPLGAMIPGALVGMALCLLLRKNASTTAVVAALAAVGVGFGGQMTYGNTIALAIAEATRTWGLLGLTVKGAIWGLLGGGVIGLALERGRISWPGLLAMLAGTWAGWWFVNVPRLVYFSIDRHEVWAGLLVGALALLAVERSRVAWQFALVACVGGGFGFGFGGWLQVWGRWNAPHAWVGWWKVMEFFFGAAFGVALGWSAWKWSPAGTVAPWRFDLVTEAVGRLAVLPALYLSYEWGMRFGYTVVGAALIAMVGWRKGTAWLVASTMTAAAFVFDLTHYVALLVLVVLLAHAAIRTYEQSPLKMFLILTWSANAIAMLKALRSGHFAGEHAMFLVMGALVTLLALRLPKSDSL